MNTMTNEVSNVRPHLMSDMSEMSERRKYEECAIFYWSIVDWYLAVSPIVAQSFDWNQNKNSDCYKIKIEV